MLNKEKYAKEIAEIAINNETIALKDNKPISCPKIKCNDCERNTNRGCVSHILTEWANSEYKEPILDEVEKEYLSAVIKPFRKKVEYIAIWGAWNGSKQFVHIELSDMDYANLPNFETNTMYKGMKPRKHYSLEELEL